MNKYKSVLHLLVLAVIVLTGFLGAQAQPASVTITPASIDAIVKPGQTYAHEFTITNDSKTALRYRMTVGDVWFDEQNRRLSGRAGTLPRSAALWVQFTPAEVIVEPRSSATVRAVIVVPRGVTGSYYAVPAFEGLPVENPVVPVADQGITGTAMIGIDFNGLMMFTTSEGAEYNVEIMGGKVVPPTASTEMEIDLDVRNRGTAHASIRGAFAILNSSGALVGRGTTEERRVVPTQRRPVKGRWSGELPPGRYSCLVTLSYNRVGLEPSSVVYEIPFTVE